MTELMPMPAIERAAEGDDAVDEAELAAAAEFVTSLSRRRPPPA